MFVPLPKSAENRITQAKSTGKALISHRLRRRRSDVVEIILVALEKGWVNFADSGR